MTHKINVGGNGYRWRGRSIRTVRQNNATCVTMPRKDSMVQAPAEIHAGITYRVNIMASRNGGNGTILVNFFGGRNYDGSHIAVTIKSNKMTEYSIVVKSPKFPKNVPMFLRVWRPNSATGNVFIRSIICQVHTGDITKASKARNTRHYGNPEANPPNLKELFPKSPSKVKKIKKKTAPIITPKGNPDMKFQPYKYKTSKQDIADVLVSEAKDVPMVSIITPTRDGEALIKSCYSALVKNTCYPNWEWIVGDSNSSDKTVEYLKSLNDSRIKIVERRTTDGSFSSINNELVKHAKGEYYLFLNDDTEPQPFWLFEMMTKIVRNPDVGIVGAKLLYAPGKIQHAGIAFIEQGPANLGKAVLKSFPKSFANYDRYYQAVTGACLLISRKDFDEVGKFDPVYYFCYDDIDLCLKVHFNLKKKILYAARAEVLHKESITQNKYKTHGELQQKGIAEFKARWMRRVVKDFVLYQKDMKRNLHNIDISFVTCVNDIAQYRKFVLGSLFKSETKKQYEVIPVLNFDNPYSASQALNLGLDQSRGKIIVFCHQDVLFYKNWIDLLYTRIKEIELRTTNWGIIGTAGISKRDDTVGVVHSMKGSMQWRASKRKKVYPVQTLDEHCFLMRKNCKLRFDEKTMDGWHFYGVDLALQAAKRGMTNFGIMCPLVHGSGSASLNSGREEFMRLLKELARKWRPTFSFIRTPTSIISKRSVKTFITFKE